MQRLQSFNLLSMAREVCDAHRGDTGLFGSDTVDVLLQKHQELCDANASIASSLSACFLTEDVHTSLTSKPGLAKKIIALLDADGDGLLEQPEVELAALLISVTADVDEASFDKRRAYLEQLAQLAASYSSDPKLLDPDALLGRLVVVEGLEAAVRVVRVQQAASKPKKPTFELLEVGSDPQRTHHVELQHKRNLTGTAWRPAPPVQSITAVFDVLGGVSKKSPLLESLKDDPVVKVLSGETLAEGRTWSTRLAESTYRLCGIVPCWPALPCFWVYGLLVGSPCAVCCSVPSNARDRGAAHSITLRERSLLVRSTKVTVLERPYIGLNMKKIDVPPVEEVFPLSELRGAAVLPPRPGGLNGWCHSLVVYDKDDVPICCVDGTNVKNLQEFVDAMNSACKEAQSKPLPANLISEYTRHSNSSWLAFERARHSIVANRPIIARGSLVDDSTPDALLGRPSTVESIVDQAFAAPSPESMDRDISRPASRPDSGAAGSPSSRLPSEEAAPKGADPSHEEIECGESPPPYADSPSASISSMASMLLVCGFESEKGMKASDCEKGDIVNGTLAPACDVHPEPVQLTDSQEDAREVDPAAHVASTAIARVIGKHRRSESKGSRSFA
ncbi:hypothetical protein AB1Y20_016368 [Prymnesium parvum]|uniref:EF-hand domain-containing protein n=1 Tax=Prymnesium parvum TaxID=97485 RepID=A0AB34IG74_PRYPA